jgi:hypothetical protein
MADSYLCQSVKGLVIVYLFVYYKTTMPVRSILAEANIGNYCHLATKLLAQELN